MRQPWFEGKAAIVTGGGSGIGRGISYRLAAAGVAVIVADVARQAAETVAHELEADGGKALPVTVDVADENEVGQMVSAAVQGFGRLDFLVNCAGNAVVAKPVVELPLDDWQSLIDVHLTGTFLCCRAAFDHVVAAQGGVVNLSSNYGFKGRPNGSQYSAAKAGIVALTKTLALEMAPNATANAIAPGPIDTPRWRGSMSQSDYEGKKAGRIQDIPMGRMGQPDDIAGAAMFLLGPEAQWVTGQVMHVNGGEFLP